ncbi:MAG: ribonuclease E/G, partial [Planctomycetota bacterium]
DAGAPAASVGRRSRRRRSGGAGRDASGAGAPEGDRGDALPGHTRVRGRTRRGRSSKETRDGARRDREGERDSSEPADADAGVHEDDDARVEAAEAAAGPVEKVLLVNAADPEEVRIALLEDGRVEELYVEVAEERSATGNVYRGRVQNVEKGIGAAFIDLGRGLTGFLHGSDIPNRDEGQDLTSLLEPGQEVLVQVTRDSIGRKGPALTGRIALPGRYLVLLTTSSRSGVSRRIGRGRARDRLRQRLDRLEVPEGMGLIVRTAGEEARYEDLARDLDHLAGEWRRLETLAAQPGPPALLRPESDVAERSIRDIMPSDIARIVVDREDVAARVRTLLGAWYGPIPRRRIPGEVLDATPGPARESANGEEPATEDPKPAGSGNGEGSAGAEEVEEARPMPEVEVHDGPMPLFHAFDVESQLEDAFRRTVRLPSGGSIVIDPTEALVAIDVNSGRLTAAEDPEETALCTNLEAAAEAARQLRLRDLGGLIVLDLIDMRGRTGARKVERALKRALARDRARIRVGRIDEFGCLILSRQRVRQALSRVTHAECSACGGTGRRRHPAGLGLRVLREMRARAARAQGRGGLEVRVPGPVRAWILRHRPGVLRAIEDACSGPVRLEEDVRLAVDGWAMKGLPPQGSPEGS